MDSQGSELTWKNVEFFFYSLVGFGDERSIVDGLPFQPSLGPAVDRIPPRRKSSPPADGLEGSPSRAPELFRFSLDGLLSICRFFQ